MGRTLIRHADILTLDEEGRLLLDADIAIADGMIAAIGVVPDGFQADEVVDAAGNVVLPGLFNAHTHSPMALLSGRAPSAGLDRWLDDRDWLAESGLSGDDVFWGASLAACRMIRHGIVGFADQYFYMDRVAEATVQSGLRANLAWQTFGSEKGEIGTDLAGVAAFVEEWQGAAEDRIRTSLAPHSPEECSPVFLARTAAVAAWLEVGIHLHLADSERKVAQSLALHDMTPVEVLNRNGVFDVPVVAAHCIHVTEPDRAILASKGVTAVHCPVFQARRGTGVTPVAQLRAHGVAVVLGTERPTVDGRMDMLETARLAAMLQRVADRQHELPDDQEMLRMATSGAAKALGFALSGILAPGYAADLILLDRRAAGLSAGSELAEAVLYGASGSDVTDTMVAGRWLMRRQQLLTLDEARIEREAARRGMRLVGSQGV